MSHFDSQVNCLSFNPYSEFILATGSADKTVSRDHDKAMYEHSSSMIKLLSCMSIAHT